MATVATPHARQSGIHRSKISISNAIDRWIYVFTAAFFIAVTLTGFIPDALGKIEAVRMGARPPFPLVLHFHSVLMGAFLLLLLAQSSLAATGRIQYHQRLGMSSAVLAPAIVVVGFILVPTMYHQVWDGMQAASGEARAGMQEFLLFFDNIMLFQIRVGIVFPLLFLIAFLARRRDLGLHKRMMFLAVVPALAASFDRITWLPHTFPETPLSADLYPLLAVAPMFIWDVVRTRSVHKAYWIFLAVMAPTSILIHALWGSDWWHATAPRLVGAA